MSALKMHAVRAEISDLEGGVLTEALFDGEAPLLNVLSGRVSLHAGEADGSNAEDWRCEIEAGQGRGEVVALLRDGKNIRNVVALIAPAVHVHGSEENAVGAVKNDPPRGNVAREAEARSEVSRLKVLEPLGVAVLASNEDLGRAIDEREIRVGI